MDNRKISLAIPTWNRSDVLMESFMQIVGDERIEHIHISDDASDIEIYNDVKSKVELTNQFAKDKITLSRNITNQDCFFNKRTAVLGVKSAWLILADSDNTFGIDYLDKLFSIGKWEEDTIYTPDWAQPHFNFTPYSNLLLTKENIAEWIDKPMLETMLNASNFFINKEQYLKVWDGSVDPVTSDSIFFAYTWLKAGNKIQVVDNLRYQHKVWEQSHYQNNVGRTPVGFHQEILEKIKQLK